MFQKALQKAPERIAFDSAAYIVRRPGRESWYLETYVKGVQVRRSLHTANKALALERARVQYRQLTARAFGTAPSGAVPFSHAVDELVDHLRQTGRTERTIEIIQLNADIFSRWLADELRFHHAPLLSDVTPELLQKFFGWRLRQEYGGKYKPKRKVTPSTVNLTRRVLREVFNRAVRVWSMPGPNPIAATDSIKQVKRIKWVPTEEEVLSFLEEARRPVPNIGPFGKPAKSGSTRERNPVFHDVALLIANSGLRIKEALALEWADMNTTGGHVKGGTIYVRSKEENRIKDGEERAIPLNDAVRQMLLKRRNLVPKECPWVFPNFRPDSSKAVPSDEPSGKPHNVRTLRRDFTAIATKAELPKLTPQALRRFYGTAQAQAGIPPFILKVWMGHSSVSTTEQHYIGGGTGSWMPRNIGIAGSVSAAE